MSRRTGHSTLNKPGSQNDQPEFAADPQFSVALLDWYRQHKRDLPWRRRQDDAYAIWISEIMLQQTTVAAVIGFYERWMQRFPTIEALAAASVDNVLHQWAGLGYYSRARNIKRTAEIVLERYGGKLPETVDELLTLPGIGRYTAGAIASIAYNLDAPILDANVVRVLCRLSAIQADVKATPIQTRLWSLAENVIPSGHARDFNQALMELGALVCSPTAPSCETCPVQAWCGAYGSGEPEAYPAEPKAKSWRTARHVAVAVTNGSGQLLIVRRPENATVWAGMWELPRTIACEGESLEQCAMRALRETVGLDVKLDQVFATVRHVVTVTKITLTGYATRPCAGEASAVDVSDFAWVTPDELRNYAISSPQRRLIGLWQTSKRQPNLDL